MKHPMRLFLSLSWNWSILSPGNVRLTMSWWYDRNLQACSLILVFLVCCHGLSDFVQCFFSRPTAVNLSDAATKLKQIAAEVAATTSESKSVFEVIYPLRHYFEFDCGAQHSIIPIFTYYSYCFKFVMLEAATCFIANANHPFFLLYLFNSIGLHWSFWNHAQGRCCFEQGYWVSWS